MTALIKKKSAVLLALLALILFSAYLYLREEISSVNAVSAQSNCLVIDPGHGGMDGGAISIDGSRESDINLDIALKLRAISQFCGIETVMTREDDSSSADMAVYSEHQDLVHRVSIANSTDGAVLLSIHQNCYPTSQPSGAQVLYADNEASKTLANLIQNDLVRCLDPQNRRLAEPANSKLYLTAQAKCPAVLVECGFMSSETERAKLFDAEYQKKIAEGIANGIERFLPLE